MSRKFTSMNQVKALLLMLVGCFVSAPHVSAQDSLDKHFIIGGQQVEKGDYPWTVALAYDVDADLFQRQFCGASVIADKWVLTAAHCLFDRRSDVLATTDFKVAINATFLPDPDAVELIATNIFIHPDYDHSANNPHSDIALIELATESGITPIKLSTKITDELVGLQATVIGWGATDDSDPSNSVYPNWAHEVDVPIVSLDICNAPQSYANAIYSNQLCAGYAEGGRDSCVGDSGGPLVVTFEGELQQVGVVSFGFGCAIADYYGIYTTVPYFIGWINEYVFVGTPEYEPVLLIPRSSTQITTSSDSAGGATSLFGMLLLGCCLLIRRRS